MKQFLLKKAMRGALAASLVTLLMPTIGFGHYQGNWANRWCDLTPDPIPTLTIVSPSAGSRTQTADEWFNKPQNSTDPVTGPTGILFENHLAADSATYAFNANNPSGTNYRQEGCHRPEIRIGGSGYR